jgi:hypothetical protein
MGGDEAMSMPMYNNGEPELSCLDSAKMHFALVQQSFARFAERYPTEALVTIVALTVLGVGILVGKAIIAIAALAVAGLLAYASCCGNADGVANGAKAFDRAIMRQQCFDAPQWIRTNEAAMQASMDSDRPVERSGRRSAPVTPSSASGRMQRVDSRPASTANLQLSSPGASLREDA